VGPGDDCAWLDGFAVSVDTVVEGVHFRFDWSSPEDVGWKAMCAALSDLAASRARPRGALISLSVPASELTDAGLADRLMAGITEASLAYRCPVIGGDVCRTPGPVQISVTVIGDGIGAPLLRSGAGHGDLVQRSGPTGWSALAIKMLQLGETPPARALDAHRRPHPRLDLLDALTPATAAIDISDGLLADAAHIAHASRVAVLLDRDACVSGGPPSDEALSLQGGEDFELIICAPSPLDGFSTIGRIEATERPSLLWSNGAPVPSSGRGWDHGGQH